jgi:hypothetical protein
VRHENTQVLYSSQALRIARITPGTSDETDKLLGFRMALIANAMKYKYLRRQSHTHWHLAVFTSSRNGTVFTPLRTSRDLIS